ncbi:peptide deformylase [Candidatus Parcubacteria bacterium]|nr:MAG: peptide deformylase [Candidatus Parcubacteria bacterium]
MAEILNILLFPDKGLQKKSKKIKDFNTDEINQLILDMDKTMKERNGIGLAAPQVGKNIRLILVNTEKGSLALLNPKIKRKSWAKELGEEGCLSLPEIWGLVKRCKKIKVEAMTKQGKKITFEAEGLFARVIQHEVDHLDGILFIKRTKKIVKGADKLAGLGKSKK